MSIKVTADNYPEIIEIYNNEGKAAACELVREKFGIQYPNCLMSKLRRKEELGYDPGSDRFQFVHNQEENLFLSMEELCEHEPTARGKAAAQATRTSRAEVMENMIHTLVSDRLLELSRYVLLDPVDKKILVSKSSMQADGYCVEIN